MIISIPAVLLYLSSVALAAGRAERQSDPSKVKSKPQSLERGPFETHDNCYDFSEFDSANMGFFVPTIIHSNKPDIEDHHLNSLLTSSDANYGTASLIAVYASDVSHTPTVSLWRCNLDTGDFEQKNYDENGIDFLGVGVTFGTKKFLSAGITGIKLKGYRGRDGRILLGAQNSTIWALTKYPKSKPDEVDYYLPRLIQPNVHSFPQVQIWVN